MVVNTSFWALISKVIDQFGPNFVYVSYIQMVIIYVGLRIHLLVGGPGTWSSPTSQLLEGVVPYRGHVVPASIFVECWAVDSYLTRRHSLKKSPFPPIPSGRHLMKHVAVCERLQGNADYIHRY